MTRGIFVATLVAATAAAEPTSGATLSASDDSFAVVELFTSQGCSSCPPADRMLRQIEALAIAQQERVFVLSFHVDYWNRLGWRDPFSSPVYSKRQNLYARANGTDRIYTPQMVVNGRRSFVGSRRRTAQREISAALERRPHIASGVRAAIVADRKVVRVEWVLGADPGSARLVVALTESGLSNRVDRGENRGSTSTHDGVVRRLLTLRPRLKGDTTLPLPDGFDPARGAVVLLVQDQTTMAVLGAAQARL